MALMHVARASLRLCLLGMAPGLLLLAAAPAARADVAAAAQDASPGALRVRVMDQDWDVPLPGALVQILEANRRSVSGDDGSALFDALPGGAYTVVVTAPGFERRVLSRVVVIPGEARFEETRLSAAFTDMEEFVVRDADFSGLGSDLQQLELRALHSGLMDTVGADMMSRAGAGTAAAALRLVTGATIQDGKYAVIRGLGDRYTATLVNNVRMPTADKDKRAVHMDQFPSSLIESIQVTKTFLPDQQGDASGGINIITRGVPESRVLNFSLSTEYDTNATGERRFKSYAGGGNRFGGMRGPGSLRFWDAGSLRDPRGVSSRCDPESGRRLTVPGERYSAALRQEEPPMNYGFRFAAGDVVDKGSWRLGGLLTGSYSQDYKYRLGTRFDRLHHLDASKIEPIKGPLGRASVENSTDEQLWSAGLTMGAEHERHAIKATALYTHLSRDVVELRHGPRGDTTATTNEIRSGRATIGTRVNESRTRPWSAVMHYAENANASLQLAGRHTLGWLNESELDWTGAYNIAESIEPDRRSIGGAYVYRRETRSYNPGRPEQPSDESSSEMDIDDFERRWQDTREAAWQGQVNLKTPYTLFDQEGHVKGGLFGDAMDRVYRNRVFMLTTARNFPARDEYDYSGFDALDAAEFPANINPKSIEYDGVQKLSAAYLMARAPLPEWLDVVGGARFESTLMETKILSPEADKIRLYYLITEANATNDEERKQVGRIGFRSNVEPREGNARIDQLDVLPALAMTLRPIEDVSLRLGYGRTIARPTFKEITPVLYQDFDASRVFLGNPHLAMSTLNNYDARIEWRPGGGADLLAASVFYKTIADPIQYSTRRDTQPGGVEYIYPENYGDAEITGIEFEARKGLGFISSWVDAFSVGGNLTLQESSVMYPTDLREQLRAANVRSATRAMDGQSDILGNLNLIFDHEATGISVGIFYNLRGETYVSGDTATSDTYIPALVENPIGTLDVTFRFQFAKSWRLGLEAKNLLNPSIETVQRTPFRDLPYETHKAGRTFGVSLGYDW